MRRFKTLSLLSIGAAALTIFAATASADYVTTTTGGAAATPNIHAVNEGGHVPLANPVANISCSSTVEAPVESHGAGIPVTAEDEIDHLTFTGCTNLWHVTPEDRGGLDIEWTSGHNGAVFSSGARIWATRSILSCVYETDSTHIGTLTGGNPATLHIEAFIPINEEVSSPFCGQSNAEWEGNYVTTSALYVVDS